MEEYSAPEQEALPWFAIFVLLYVISDNYLHRTKSPHVTQVWLLTARSCFV